MFPSRASYATPKRIGFVGRLSSEKSIGLALTAFSLLLPLHPHSQLHIFGSGFLVSPPSLPPLIQ